MDTNYIWILLIFIIVCAILYSCYLIYNNTWTNSMDSINANNKLPESFPSSRINSTKDSNYPDNLNTYKGPIKSRNTKNNVKCDCRECSTLCPCICHNLSSLNNNNIVRL